MHYLLMYDLAPDYLERRAAFRDEHQKATTGGMILHVCLEVLRQLSDARGEQRDLHVGTSRVLLVHAERLNFLSLCHKKAEIS